MFRRLLATTPTWVTLPLRLALGIIFIAHGIQLVFGTWSGPGLKTMMSFPAPFAFMRPAWAWMAAAALSQLVGGVLVLLGLLTRLGAFMLMCVMLIALVGMSLALLIAGGGQMSADNALAGGRGYRR